jgi:branched-chain amino acid transport system substrate-binding protein
MMKHQCLLPLLAAIVGCGSSTSLPPIYIGHVATTSGAGRAVGMQEVRGISLAIEELTRDGQNLVGDRPVYVKHVDARGQLETMEGEAVRLVTLSRALGLYGGNSREQVLRLKPARVPLVTPLGGRPQGPTELIFTTGLVPAAQAEALARFAAGEKGLKQVAILLDERLEDGRSLAEAFERALQKALEEKKEPVSKSTVISFGKEAKFAELSQALPPTGGMVFIGTEADYVNWCKAYSYPGIKMLLAPEESTVFDDAFGPVYRARAFAVDADLPKTVAFAKAFRENYKEEPGVAAALAYDGIRMIIEALRRAQTPTPEYLLEELRKTKDFAGLTGSVSFSPEQQLKRPVFVGRQLGTAFATEKRYDP